MKFKDIINLAGFVALLSIFFLLGYRLYPKWHKCPQITSDTLIIKDTAFISFPPDTLFLPSDTVFLPSDTQPVDTLAILADYYNKYTYPWVKQDTNIIITGITEVHKNRMTLNYLQYKLLRPQTIIHNTTVINQYNRYVSIGFNIPIRDICYTEIEALYHFRDGYFGLGYTPELKSFNVKSGFNIINF